MPCAGAAEPEDAGDIPPPRSRATAEPRGADATEDDPEAEPETATRIALRAHDPHTGAEIERGELRKGYEYARG